MKKFLSGFFLIVLLVSIGLFYGCGERYAGLTFSMGFSYNKSDKDTTTLLDDGTYRVVGEKGTFDDHMDGSYTFYIQDGEEATANFEVKFNGAPDDFNYGVSFSLSNEILKIANATTYTKNGIKKEITAYERGSTVLTAYSTETGKSSSIVINVVKVASAIEFENNNLAITSSLYSKLNLKEDAELLLTPKKSSITKITYKVGYLESENFVEYSTNELLNKGINFNKSTLTLEVVKENLLFDSFYIQAIYENPLEGEDLIKTTEVRVVKPIEDFVSYVGVSRDDEIAANLITLNKVQELIINIEGLNYVDLFLKVRSQGEKVNFSYIANASLPVYFLPNKSYYEYVDKDGYVLTWPDAWKDAEYTYYYVRAIADKKTTENDVYESGIYKLTFTCNYVDYLVDGYPISNIVNVKNDTLIKNFSVNGVSLDNESIIESPSMQGFYDEEVYINNDVNAQGTALKVDIGNPVSISAQNAKFKVSFYASDNRKIENVDNFFKVQKSVGNSSELVNINDNFVNSFDKNTTFYIKPNAESDDIDIGQVYYMILTAVKPVGHAEKQAVATIRLRIVQGISSFKSYEYSLKRYEVEEATGQYLLVDGKKQEVLISNTGVLFDTAGIGQEIINLDLESNFDASVTLSYLPVGADLNNITIVSNNERIIKVTRDDKDLEKFYISPISIGEASVSITTTNLEKVYIINVNVYRPITNFSVNLTSTSSSYGVGGFVTDGNNIKQAEVKVAKQISLALSTLPSTASQYSLSYAVYKESVLEENLVGSYFIDYNGIPSSNISLIGNSEFQFDCARNSFVFIKDESVGKLYIVVLKLTNLDGSYWEHEIKLTSYVPVESIDTDLTRNSIYNPNTIAYALKTKDNNDPSSFGIKIETNKKSKRVATYNFANYGKIVVIVNGVNENIFTVSGGILNQSNSNSVINMVSAVADDDGYYWFKLNEEYNYDVLNSLIYLSIQIREINNDFLKPVSLRVFDAELVSKLRADSEDQIYFKQGLTPDKNIKLKVSEDNAFDKTLLVKTYDIVTYDGVDYYYENIGDSAYLQNVEIEETNNKTEYILNISPNQAGKSVIVVMPQDKLISLQQYNCWYEKDYIEVNIEEEDFVENKFYFYELEEYVLAETYEEGKKYYIYTSILDDAISVWKNFLTFYVTVADGVKIPYQIASQDDLLEIEENASSVEKKYVLTKDIIIDSNINWKPLGNFYKVQDVTADNFFDGKYYSYDENSYKLESAFVEGTEYYAYGFNGELSGKYSYVNIKTNKEISYYHKITNVTFVGFIEANCHGFGLFAETGKNSKVIDLEVNYNFFQPNIRAGEEYNLTFGGISAYNHGEIVNSKVKYQNFTIATSNNLTFGGVVGVNYGDVRNENPSSTGITGVISINLNATSATEAKNLEIFVGGFVGSNKGRVVGSYDTSKEIEYTFNNAGFDSSLNIDIKDYTNDDFQYEKAAIGGAVGENHGSVKYVSIQGRVRAVNCDNVGGLIGHTYYNENFNGEKKETIEIEGGETEEIEYTLYSVESSYSIAIVEGRNRVGGAIGYAGSDTITEDIYIYNISAENYVTSANTDRTFVKGNNFVGGLIGVANRVRVYYSYVISYFDCSMVTNTEYPDKCYDIVSLSKSAAFICQANNVIIANSASYANVKSSDVAALFVAATEGVVSATDVFAIGSVYGFSVINTLSITATGTWYSICHGEGSSTSSSSSGATDMAQIKTMPISQGWARSADINDGYPYLTIVINEKVQVLFATTPINIVANVKDNNGDYTSYIKNDNESLILYYNYDYLNQYKVEDIQKLNLVILNTFADLEVYAKTHKTARLNISTSAPDVIAINEDGTLRILKEGKAIITISSKLNNDFKAQITIVVKFGVNDISLYSNVALTNDLKEPDSKIEMLKSKNHTLYLETLYTRDLQTEEDATLKSTTDIAVRFSVADDANLTNILDAADGNFDGSVTLTLDDIFKMNGFAWVYDGGNYTVDIPANTNPVITPYKAMDSLYRTLTISYVPIIKQTFTTLSSTIVLEEFRGSFVLSIIKGATGIIFENNLDVTDKVGVEISQLETHTFTVTLFTDYELDEIVDTIDIKNINNMLTVVKSDNVRGYKDAEKTVLESISITYTINYKDKMNAVEQDINYLFEFYAASDVNQKIVLPFTILGQDKINQVYGTIYSNLTDFPQQPDKNNIIYNANVGVLSVEVYPYFSNYNKMRVYYQTSSEYPLLMTQLSYNISGEAGELLTDYPNSGAVTDYYDVMMVEKSSGQDTYLLNNLGTYSYSKIYFFSLLVGSSVPDNTKFTVYVEFLNRQDTIIHTFKQEFITIAQPSITFTFDDKLLSEDKIYYLPLNTDNEIDVKLVNFDGDITWTVTSNEYEFTANELEVLTPKLNEEGKYIFRVLRYTAGSANDNVFNENLLGKKIRLTAYITDNQREYSYSQDILVTLFTVRDINVQNTTKGYMTLPMSTTSPLQVVLDLHYDKNLVEKVDNWYSNWYAIYEETADTTHILYKYLTACGYELTANFAGYFTQLTNSISKANYNYLDTSTTKTSGVWFYNAGDDSGYLQTNKDYNNSTFGVEFYNDFFAVYGFQIDTNSNLSLKVNLSYTNNEGQSVKNIYANGVPNVYNYNISVTNATYETHFRMSKDFVLNFVYKSDLINAIPVATAEDFINMKEGFDYRLVNDIVLKEYVPISTAINTFDGNNYKIYITSFGIDNTSEQECVLGLFADVSEETILYNVTVCYTNKVTVVNEEYVPGVAPLNAELFKANTVTFGGIAGVNNGTLTNCKVTGKVNLSFADVNSEDLTDSLNGSLVAQNTSTGYITNSQVKNFDLSCYGETGGFVGQNSGKIISSYFDNSSVNNLSGDSTAGFVNYNEGEIHECYVQGYRSATDNNISNTGAGISSKGRAAGFVYSNIGEISDCYSNVSLSSSKYIAGFIYEDAENSVISRCYSISQQGVEKSAVASPFIAANSAGYTTITVSGILNNCYYLNEVNNPWTELSWSSSEENKQAKALSLDDFATHTKFVNYDLSLVYNKGYYADNKTTYNYVDGYTWVIIEGKPVIVSTLIDTISQRDYIGKSKNYSDASYVYFNQDTYGSGGENIVTVQVAVGQDKIRTSYYDNTHKIDVNLLSEEQLLFYTIQDNTALTLTYYFVPPAEDSETITIMYSITLKEGVIETKKLVSAEYGNEGNEKKILDTKEVGVSNKDYIEDRNFRANDTLEITYNNKGVISKIDYKVLESASYYYGSNAFETSHVIGSRTNPQIIYDYESFVYYTATENLGRYYRVIKDIDFNYQFTPTAYATFQGSLQGNFMDFNNLSISYLNNYTDNNNLESGNAFGLFATISTINSFVDDAGDVIDDSFYTIVSNLRLNVIEVLSNSHNYVGALAGQLKANYPSSNKMVIINNVSVQGVNERSAYIQGKNAVGGLVGAAYGNVIIKDISCAVNVNATKEMSYGDVQKILYAKDKNPISNIAYAGGVVGIFDANKVNDPSTQKNYNANNISISGEISIIGGVVGSAFGLIGPTTVVNYVNTVVTSSQKTYLKATSYAGGLVGENRGDIISSSVTYGAAETYSSVKPGSSTFIEHNYFYNGYTSDNPIAIGGLVGLNNGGRISHSIATVDVRNKKAEVAGGAIGRMIQGKIDHVVSSGSVVGKTIIGGFIGTVNDRDILTNAGYNTDAITNQYDGKTVKTIITNCVSATNWLISDYTYYRSVLNSGNPVSGFIGLIAYSSMEDDIGFVGFTDGIDSGNTYFSNTLYTSSNSERPQKYLKAAYQSESLDLLTKIEEGAIDVFYDGDGKQIVYPYSIREFYYEDTLKNVSYQIKTETRTSNTTPDGLGPIFRTSYIVEFFNNIENIADLYVKAVPDLGNGEWPDTIEESVKTYDWYILHFAKIYLKDGTEFKEIKNETEFNNLTTSEKSKLYYIPNPVLNSFTLTDRYTFDGINDIVLGLTESISSTKLDDHTFSSIGDFDKVKSFIINGIEIININKSRTKKDTTDENGRTQRLYTCKNINVTLPNGSTISQVKYYIVPKVIKTTNSQGDIEEIEYFTIDYIDITYVYNTNNSKFIKNVNTSVSRSQQLYSLSVASKAVIYDKYLQSSYWKAGSDFLLNASYDKANKYLINLELADVYLWDTFLAKEEDLTKNGDYFEIETAEELALFANLVNTNKKVPGTSDLYATQKVKIVKDIDLSGKYWVPIGTATYPFKGTFTGLYSVTVVDEGHETTTYHSHVIKYATVNENSNRDTSRSTVKYAGLFGYVSGATISDLVITGGDMVGEIAGGVVAYSVGTTTINNVINRNNVSGLTTAGGLVGRATSTLKLSKVNNYGEINHNNSSTTMEGFGGLVGRANTLEVANSENNGGINLFNNKTSYSGSGKQLSINVGGIVGRVANISFSGENFNEGDISVRSNAHTLSVGGIIGLSQANTKVIANLKNYGDINVNYNNIYSVAGKKVYAIAAIGGIAGYLKNNLTLSGNEGKIYFTINTTSNSYIGIGGIAGILQADNTAITGVKGISQSYNTNNIEITSISNKTHIAFGGITGYVDATTTTTFVQDCYNSGDLLSDSNATSFAGGIVGATIVLFEEDGAREFLYSQEEPVGTLAVKNTLNIGYVNVTNINTNYNALGAIVGISDTESATNGLLRLVNGNNYYLRDSAYSGTKIYPGYSVMTKENIGSGGSGDKYTYEPVVTENEVGCDSNLVTTLKTVDTYDGWDFSATTGVWEQSYDTWFPSIKNNLSSSMWDDKQEELSQEKGSYIVNSAEQLAFLSAKINSGEIESTNITIKLTDFVDLSNRYWTPIGTKENPFKGSFDGAGYVIRNLTIDGSVLDNDEYGGLFGYVEDATIENIGLESVIIKNVNYAAAIAYSAKNSKVSKVYSDYANSNDSIVSAKFAAGGLICFADNCNILETNNYTGGLYYSYNNVPVEITGTYSATTSFVGGLVARLRNSLIDSSYNNKEGIVKTSEVIEDENTGTNNSIVIAGYADRDSSLFNVFNLSTKVKVEGASKDNYNCLPLLYNLEVQDGKVEALINPSSQDPSFENLATKDGINNKDIWTEEYTLNDKAVNNKYYPSIRGLGQEWKNTESEALISISYSEIDTRISATLEQLEEKGIPKTLVNRHTDDSELNVHNKIFYLVTSEEELAWIATNVNSGNLLTTNSEFILLKDLDLSKRYWTPIGSSTIYPFQGVFNFNGHTIRGLTIDSTSLTYGGLFGYTNGATIVDGYLIDSFIKVKSEDPMTNIYVGSLVGKGWNTTILNFSITTALAGFSNSGVFVGGAIGSLAGTQDYLISNIRVEKAPREADTYKYSYIDVSSYYNQVVEIKNEAGEETGDIKNKTTNIGAFSSGGNVYAGGVVGYISGYELQEVKNEYLIDAAYNDCNISAVSTSNAASTYLGGVVGFALEQVTLNNIKNIGNLKSFTYQYDTIGGVVGYMSNGNIQNAYFGEPEIKPDLNVTYGYIEPCQDFNNHIVSYVGGILGVMQSEGYIKQCVNKGRLNANSNYKTNASIGGIIGVSKDRRFDSDEKCVYSKENNFDYPPIGFDEQLEKDLALFTPAQQEEKKAFQDSYDTLIADLFTNEFSDVNSNNKFDGVLWSNSELNSIMTYVCGCGTSFDAISVDGVSCSVQLKSSGKLAVNLSTVTLKYGTGDFTPGDKIGIALTDANYNYIYREVALTGDASNLNLQTQIEKAFSGVNLHKKPISCCVTLISAKTGS